MRAPRPSLPLSAGPLASPRSRLVSGWADRCWDPRGLSASLLTSEKWLPTPHEAISQSANASLSLGH